MKLVKETFELLLVMAITVMCVIGTICCINKLVDSHIEKTEYRDNQLDKILELLENREASNDETT